MLKKLQGFLLYIGITTFFVLGTAAAMCQPPNYAVDGVAVHGYDVVAYFTEGKPVKGSPAFAFTLDSVQWHFSSREHLDLFKANPERYLPQFGGWCAYGVSQNYKAPTEPDAWTIVNDKLYLNYNKKVRNMWLQDRDARIHKAEQNWTELEYKY